jgi:hypothetical protein
VCRKNVGRVGFNGWVEVAKDGRTWRLGGRAAVEWIGNGVTAGCAITAAIPPVFPAYATLWDANEDRATTVVHEQAVLTHLTDHTASDQPWWLGFLDTGAHDVVFNDAPRVTLYSGWRYVLVEAGPRQAATWRTGHMRSGDGTLPDLIFPADRSWLVSALWDDTWTCVGGPRRLIDSLERDVRLHARSVRPDEDVRPPDLPFD